MASAKTSMSSLKPHPGPLVADMSKGLTTAAENEKVGMESRVESTTTTTLPANEEEFKPDLKFWLVFGALCTCSLLSALDLVGIGTAAPTIVHDLHGADFTWVSAAYALASAACVPLSSNLAQIFGRRIMSLIGIVFFAAGSAVCGSASQMTVLVVGRAIQGAGSGTMQALNSMIITDLVPLRHRGAYAGVTGLVYTLGGAGGPFVAGALSEKATWRWIFYLNLPLSGIAFASVFAFLHLKKPEGKLLDKLLDVDWIGNLLIMGSTCACMIALTLGGVHFPWSSPRILAPLIIGGVGLVVTLFYESRWPRKPVVPLLVFSNRTSILAYIGTFIQGIVSLGISYYLPSWFQAVKLSTPILSGLYVLPMTLTISPSAIIQGIIISKTGRYRPLVSLSLDPRHLDLTLPQILFGWVTYLLGLGLLIILRPSTSVGVLVPIQLLAGVGNGFLYATTVAVLAPLPIPMNPPAMAFQVFLRQFSQAWGIAIGGTILQNSLSSRLPAEVVTDGRFSSAGELAYAIIPAIPDLPEPLRTSVRAAFNDSFRNIWIAFTICNAVGLLTFFGMKNFPLAKTTDGKWGIDRTPKKQESEDSATKEKLGS
ncbi:MFS multidrug transporter [Crepidotus variabilis]|uniref:MFS multidrug transporter n=1 Tax=Crepidotus variabilis TaxID=179855 RepID=A0A9P6ELN0_9AGAR|nr:MFS multidrug transporter [Crepidotus variabilis]